VITGQKLRFAREKAKDARRHAGQRSRVDHLLADVVREADELAACNPALLNDCQIVRGYAEFYDHYDAGKFPWVWVRRIIARMRKGPAIANAA
jgi:hypothetical protein